MTITSQSALHSKSNLSVNDLTYFTFQEPFDDIATNYVHALPDGGSAIVEETCTYNSSRTKLLVQYLFEYIILKLNKEAVGQEAIDPGTA